jgi:hypothetical protein
MEAATKTRIAASRKLMGRSAVTTGNADFLPSSASVLRKARRYRDILAELVSDLGGDACLSEAQRQLCRRAVTLSLQCEHWDAAAAAGKDVDWDLYSRTTNTLRRVLEAIGDRGWGKPAQAVGGPQGRAINVVISGPDRDVL